MSDEHPQQLSSELAHCLREAKSDLVARWLERISARVTLSPNEVFPTGELLNHVPLLIDGIADFLESPGEDIDAEIPVSAKAMELGALRHAQGFDAYEILKEHEMLGAIIFSYLSDVVDAIATEAPRRDFLICWQRIAYAIELIRQATMTHFLRLSAEQVNEREERLRRFNTMVSHELKNRIGAIRGAAHLLHEGELEPQQRQRFERMILENAEGVQRVLVNLVTLSQLETDSRQRRNIVLPQAAAEAIRQLRELAQANAVSVDLADDLPSVEVDAAAVELCLVNYISNAIKYSDPSKSHRWVKVEGELQFHESATGGELLVRVRDNGIGVPEPAREPLFQQFYRAHEHVTGIEGTGLGLSIVRETVESLGGRAWAEFPDDGGAVFAFALPSRREGDSAAAGTHRPEGV